MTYSDVLKMEIVPTLMLIVGSGAKGDEFAGIDAALGRAITWVEPAECVQAAEGAEVNNSMAKALAWQEITVRTGQTVHGVEREDSEVVTLLSGGSRVLSDRVLPAACVVPNVTRLGLDRLGLRVKGSGPDGG